MSFEYQHGDDLAFLTAGSLEISEVEQLARTASPMTQSEWEERFDTICD